MEKREHEIEITGTWEHEIEITGTSENEIVVYELKPFNLSLDYITLMIKTLLI